MWIPDSSIRLHRLRATGPDWVPAAVPSVTRSPIVLAIPQPAMAALGSPDTKLAWTNLLPRLASDATLRAGMVDPNRDAASTSGVLALAAAAKTVGGQQASAAALRTLAAGSSALRADLLARFPVPVTACRWGLA